MSSHEELAYGGSLQPYLYVSTWELLRSSATASEEKIIGGNQEPQHLEGCFYDVIPPRSGPELIQ